MGRSGGTMMLASAFVLLVDLGIFVSVEPVFRQSPESH
jgi:hypothetical protein